MTAPAASEPVPTSRLGALFLISCGLLLIQVALAKIFSIVLWYHFGFLVISIALLGFALSGVWLATKPELLDRGAGLLGKLSCWAALSNALALWVVVHTRVDAMHVLRNRNEGGLLLQIIVLLVPFFFLGATVSATIALHRAKAGLVYSSNLIGSGAGCAAAIVLFDMFHWSATDVVLFGSLLMALAALMFGLSSSPRMLLQPVLLSLGALLLLNWDGRHDALHLAAPESKPLFHVEQWDRTKGAREIDLVDGGVLVFTKYELDGDHAIFTDPYGEKQRIPTSAVATQPDGTYEVRPHSLVEFTEWTSLSRVDGFIWPTGLPSWGLWGLSSAWNGKFPKQKGITIDSWAMTNVMEWKGGPTGTPEAPPEILEYLPATLVHRIRPKADVLCIGAGGGMDLLSAVRFGAKTVTGVEINPGVVRCVREAFLDFQGGLYDPERQPGVKVHVAEGRHYLERDDNRYDIVQLSGVDTASTTQAGAFSLSENFLYTREAFSTYLEHTKEGGLVTLTRWVLPDDQGLPRNTLRLFVLAWSALEDAGVAEPGRNIYLVESNGFSVILFGHQPFTNEELARLDTTCEEKQFRPIYHPARPSEWFNPTTRLAMENHFDSFAASTDKAAWLEAYPYDVSPPYDNRPFFFETSRFSQLLKKESFKNPLGGITAHGILIILLGLLGLVASLFVILPLRKLRQTSRDQDQSLLPILFYFGALGLGFILVEVVLSQQFVLYLGNPLYSLAVVLFSVLIFSGVGSAFSSRLSGPRPAIIVVVALAAIYPLILGPIFDATLQLGTGARIAISVLLLAPLSISMGMPFPLGVSRLTDAPISLVSWAWGINGYTSVLGSVLTIALSIAFGFQAVIWIGGAIYILAFLSAPLLGTRRA